MAMVMTIDDLLAADDGWTAVRPSSDEGDDEDDVDDDEDAEVQARRRTPRCVTAF